MMPGLWGGQQGGQPRGIAPRGQSPMMPRRPRPTARGQTPFRPGAAAGPPSRVPPMGSTASGGALGGATPTMPQLPNTGGLPMPGMGGGGEGVMPGMSPQPPGGGGNPGAIGALLRMIGMGGGGGGQAPRMPRMGSFGGQVGMGGGGPMPPQGMSQGVATGTPSGVPGMAQPGINMGPGGMPWGQPGFNPMQEA